MRFGQGMWKPRVAAYSRFDLDCCWQGKEQEEPPGRLVRWAVVDRLGARTPHPMATAPTGRMDCDPQVHARLSLFAGAMLCLGRASVRDSSIRGHGVALLLNTCVCV